MPLCYEPQPPTSHRVHPGGSGPPLIRAEFGREAASGLWETQCGGELRCAGGHVALGEQLLFLFERQRQRVCEDVAERPERRVAVDQFFDLLVRRAAFGEACENRGRHLVA